MSIPKNHSTFSANSNVSAQDRTEAIDFVNRLNFAFDHWNIAEMNEAFSENCIVEHPRGRVEGRAAIAKFLDAYKPLTLAGKSHRQGTPPKKVAASSDDAGFLEAEIAISLWCRGANDDVINQLELENSAGFDGSSSEADIRFRRTRCSELRT